MKWVRRRKKVWAAENHPMSSTGYSYGVGGSCHRIVVCSGDHAIRTAMASSVRTTEDLQQIASQAQAAFKSGMPCVTPGFLFGQALAEARSTTARAFAESSTDALPHLLAPIIATVDALRATLFWAAAS